MDLFENFISSIQQATLLEYVAVLFGILSVWFSKKENILVYPVGLINTLVYVYLSLKGQLFGEATVNLYYTVVSIYGWILWARKDRQQPAVLQISFSNRREWLQQIGFFSLFLIGFLLALTNLKNAFYPGVLPIADSFASATAFTGMWLMARKKVESWYWWIATNLASIPLYFIKGYSLTSLYYIVLLGLAISGWASWRKKAIQLC
jgi:nicotinamide mononucleotide transporter